MKEPDRSVDDDQLVARRLAALAHPVRLRLLRTLGERDACCVKDLVARAGLAQSTVSQHLKVLVEAGLAGYRPERQMSRYHLERDALTGLAQAIGETLHACCRAGGPCDSHSAVPVGSKNDPVKSVPVEDVPIHQKEP